MGRTVQVGVAAIAVAVSAAVAAGSNHANADTRMKKDRKLVEAAARRFGYPAISDAWAQSKLDNPVPLGAITGAVPLRYMGGHDQAGSVVVLTFASHRATCLDLVSSPIGNIVRRRSSC
jgi:hypothetical protein